MIPGGKPIAPETKKSININGGAPTKIPTNFQLPQKPALHVTINTEATAARNETICSRRVIPSGLVSVNTKNTNAKKYMTTNGAVINNSFSILANLHLFEHNEGVGKFKIQISPVNP